VGVVGGSKGRDIIRDELLLFPLTTSTTTRGLLQLLLQPHRWVSSRKGLMLNTEYQTEYANVSHMLKHPTGMHTDFKGILSYRSMASKSII
jgi:hypothetical protein